MDTTNTTQKNRISTRARAAFVAVALLASTLVFATPATANAASQQPGAELETPQAAQRFTDVPTTRGDFNAIAWMAGREITTGIGGGNRFAPDRIVTRAEFAAFLWRYSGEPEAVTSCGFTDTRTRPFAAKPACWMKAQGLTNGVGNGARFGVDQAIPRSQALTMLWRLIGSPSSTIPHGFTDIPVDAYYNEAVRWFKEFDLTTGTGPTTFGPLNNLTRGQASRFLYRYDQSKIVVSAPSDSTMDGVVGSWIGSWSTVLGGHWASLQTGMRSSVPVATFGGIFDVKIVEPAGSPVDSLSVVLPSYLPDAHTNGEVVATVSEECFGTPTSARDLQKVTLRDFYCYDYNENGVINGVVTIHMSGFEHTVRTVGPLGGFSVTYNTSGDAQHRPEGTLTANFSSDSPYRGWGNGSPKARYYPVQTNANTTMANSVPNALGYGFTEINVNNPASAEIDGVSIQFNNETSNLGLTFDNTAAFDYRDAIAPWGGAGWPGSRDPGSPRYRLVNKIQVNGECSSDPSAYVFPYNSFRILEQVGFLYGSEDTLFADGIQCRDLNGDGRINGTIALSYQYLAAGLRSFPRPYSDLLCEDSTFASTSVGCVDSKDIQYLYGSDAATIKLLSRGAWTPLPFSDLSVNSVLPEWLIAQYCSNDPLGCFPDQGYPTSMLKDQNGTYTCLLFPYLCWPEGNWPAEYKQDIDNTCAIHPTRCEGTELDRPNKVVPFSGASSSSMNDMITIADMPFMNLLRQQGVPHNKTR